MKSDRGRRGAHDKERCYTKIVGFFALQLQIQSLNMNLKEKDATAAAQHKWKKKVLYGATDDIFLWDISDISAVCTGFSA